MRSLSAALLFSLIPALPAAAAPNLQNIPRLPVLFERNSGANAQAFPVRAREKGYSLLLGRGGMQIQAVGDAPVAIRFRNAVTVEPELADPSAAVVNDYRGARANWVSGTPTWQAAEYRNAYAGINLRFYGSNGDVEYDARVSPGADPSQIEFSFDGAIPTLTTAGDLATPIGRDRMIWRKPVAYQMIGGRKEPVEARFEVHGKRVGFHLGQWDRSRELIIDPTLTFSTFLGGSGSEFARAIAVDASGNVYITGATSSGDLPVNAASYQSAYKGGGFGSPQDAFVAKLNPTGTALTYITYLGGTGIDWGLAIAADSGGDAFVTGFTDSPDFPATTGAYQTHFAGDTGSGNDPVGDAFVTKFDPSGKLVWSTYLGGAQDDAGGAIALDSAGDVIVAGSTVSPTFPVTTGALQTHYAGGNSSQIQVSTQGYVITNSGDAFIAKLDPTGTKLLASTFLGGTGNDLIDALTLDPQGNVWVGGATASNNFPVSSLALQHTFGGISSQDMQAVVQLGDGFVSELNSSLSQLTYSTYIGGLFDDAVTGIAADATGNVYVTGFTQSANFPTKGASPGSFQGPAAPVGDTPYLLGDAFAAKLSVNGGLQFSEYIGGSGDDAAASLALDSQGNMIIVGMTNSRNFPVTTGATQAGFGGSGSATFGSLGDGFLTQINGSTGATMYSTYIGGGSGEALAGIAQSTGGFTYIVGNSSSANFPTTTGVVQSALNTKVSGNSDAVIMRFSFVAATSPTIGGVTNGASYATTTFSP
ncbi:MAG TPA: SBBP repeat-containing protein, partial [Bryobacteraceae bacterium]|nr:SBBP repeat-containing protein [Bryobacteraceae bacterium]